MLRIPSLIFVVSVLCALVLNSCKKRSFEPIGLNYAGPIDVESSPDEQYFYMLNTDSEWRHNEGSILVLDTEGEAVEAVPTLRLGRSLKVRGNRMLVTYDMQDDGLLGYVEYYSLTDTKKPALVGERMSLPCQPLSSEFTADSATFFVACLGGDLYMGKFGGTELKKARSLGMTRRAIQWLEYNDKPWLLAFATDYERPTFDNRTLEDKLSFDSNGQELQVANEVPDEFESDKKARRRLSKQREPYQFIVLDISQLETAFDNTTAAELVVESEEADYERWWLYITPEAKSSGPQSDQEVENKDLRAYNTNFWAAIPIANDDKSFYLSQRGRFEGSNKVYKVVLRGDPALQDLDASGVCPETYIAVHEKCKLKTSQLLEFVEVYGASGERSNLHYAGDIVTTTSSTGKQLLLVNHFRDVRHFDVDEVEFGLEVKDITDPKDTTITADGVSFGGHKQAVIGIAALSNGRAISVLFYSNGSVLFDTASGKIENLQYQYN